MTAPVMAPRVHKRASLKILSFVEAFDIAGAAKPALEFAQTARNFGSEVVIVAFVRGPDGTESPFIQAARAAGVTVDVIHERFAFDPAVFGQIRRIIDNRRPDVIHTQVVKSHLLVRLMEVYQQIPWVAFHHGYTKTNLRTRIYNQFNRFSLKYASKVITVCGAFKAEIEKIGVSLDRIEVQHNSVGPFVCPNRAEVKDLRLKLGIADCELVLLTVGRLSAEKGHVDLLNALALLKDAPDYKLILVGDGPERAAITKCAEDLGLTSRLILAGQQQAMAPWYGLADICVIPSHSEGSPNVLLEAMSADVPVVAMAVGGIPEIVTHEYEALLAPSRNIQVLSVYLHRMMRDDRFRMNIAARASARVSQFSPERYCASLLDISEILAL